MPAQHPEKQVPANAPTMIVGRDYFGEYHLYLSSRFDGLVAGKIRKKADAEKIALAYNHHDHLVEALTDFDRFMDMWVSHNEKIWTGFSSSGLEEARQQAKKTLRSLFRAAEKHDGEASVTTRTGTAKEKIVKFARNNPDLSAAQVWRALMEIYPGTYFGWGYVHKLTKEAREK